MLALWNRVITFFTREHGATMVEYALMIALIAILSLLVVSVIGEETSNVFSQAGDGFNAAS